MREPRDISKPHPGYWMLRLAKGAVEVPAAIILHPPVIYEPGNPLNKLDRGVRQPYFCAYINGEPFAIDRVWLRRGREITEAEYRFQVKDVEWARTHAPRDPKAMPDKPIDLFTTKPPF